MNYKIARSIVGLFLVFYLSASAQENSLELKNYISVTAGINYNSGAKVFLFPRASDPDLRNLYHSFDGFTSYTIDIRANIWNSTIFVGLSTEYLKTSELLYSVRGMINNSITTFQVEEGFYLYPLELSFYYIFPFSSRRYTVYMGSGFGVYYARYFRKIYDLTSSSKVSRLDYGILVNSGVDVSLIGNLNLKLELKFRDPELEFKNEFPKLDTEINGNKILLFEKTFYTKINLDGINMILGLNYRF